ncbi:MAG: hypothetical protein J6A83_02860 [Clostridia bacterium]|nr:hypothetical protein [Clostridia bacterium]
MAENKEINIPVLECFAKPRNNLHIITNPTQLLIDSDKLRMLTLCGAHTCGMSDFEIFSAFVSNLSNMRGSGVRELFFEELNLFFDISEDVTAMDIRTLWRGLCKKIENEEISNHPALKAIPQNVFHITLQAKSYAELISENLDFIASVKSDFVSLDISDIDFRRTDKYHAEEAYKAYLRGEGSARSEFISGMLYPLCEEIKRRELSMFVYLGENYHSAKKMIEYFAEREVLPNTRAFAAGETLFRVASELCGRYGDAGVLCGFLYENGDTAESIAEKIKKIARVYPIGSLVAGGSVTNSPTFAARHNILRRGIEMVNKQI